MSLNKMSQLPGIARIWHGWTTAENAQRLESFLGENIFPGLRRDLEGLKGAQLLKRRVANEVEFTTIMWFDSLDCIKKFAGDDYKTAHVDPQVRPLLLRYDREAVHLEMSYSSM